MSGPHLETRSGRVRGLACAGGVRAFLGIPFAAPPLGPLRFAAPRPEAPWRGEREAVAFGPPAPQTRGMMARLLGLPRDPAEDCLTLNAWTPELGRGRRPVLVWIHGGSFTSGTGGSPIYDGARLARRGDVVVVTLNYRLGALGFLPFPGDADAVPPNRGLLDQVAALEWVREHAAALGGDPDRITLFGESAGAMSVALLRCAPPLAGRFARAVCQSGGGNPVHDAEAAARLTHFVLRELGVAADADAARHLAALPVDTLLGVQERALAALWRELPGLVFQPTLDGALVPEPALDALRRPDLPPMPLLIGTNADEYKLWSLTDPSAAALDEERLLRRLRHTIPGAEAAGPDLPRRAVDAYRRARRARGEPHEAPDLWFAIEGDRTLRVPALRFAEAHAAREPHTWVYRFAWCSPALEGRLGACHALEIPFVFGSLGEPSVRPFTGEGPEAEALCERMMDAWLAFARDGDPRHPGLPDWAPFAGSQRPVQVLGPDGRLGVVEAVDDPERRFWETLGTRA